MPPTVLVTGATGYIASELVAQLLDKGYTVVAAARNLEKAAFLSQFPGAQERLRVVRLDLLDGADPPVKDETMWSDPDEQRARDNFYVLSKTLAERAAWDFMDREARQFRLVTILPTMGVPARPVRQILQESLEFFRARGELP